MYLSSIEIEGYKLFNEKFTVPLNKQLTVFVGENGAGKSAIIDAIRLLLYEDEFGRVGISSKDFFRHIDKPSKDKGSDKIHIRGIFSDLVEKEKVAYLPWLDLNDTKTCYLNTVIENKEDSQGRYRWKKWGNDTSTGIFESELLDAIRCIYLPPLRNAPEKLQAFRGSRLSRLIKNVIKLPEGDGKHPIEAEFQAFNKKLLEDDDLKRIDSGIRKKLIESIGSIFGQDSLIQFSESNFNRIVERLKLLFYPLPKGDDDPRNIEMYRELDENSLGYNNILYLATVLAELEAMKEEDTFHKVLLIEEPEAHLHPQLQTKLLQYLKVQSIEKNIQVVITTHSPVVAASVGLDNQVYINYNVKKGEVKLCELSKTGLTDKSKFYLERWLDITKSTLLFAKGVLLVEGIAEALIVPELAKKAIRNHFSYLGKKDHPKTLEDFGISIINMNGIFFDHFIQLFKGYSEIDEEFGIATESNKIDIRCAGITDNDPDKDTMPTSENQPKGKNRCLYLIKELKKHSKNCRLFSNLKTFEYDLALEGDNLNPMLEILNSLSKKDSKIKKKTSALSKVKWGERTETEKAKVAKCMLDKLENSNPVGKGEFAQNIAFALNNKAIDLAVPKYIEDAINWLINDK